MGANGGRGELERDRRLRHLRYRSMCRIILVYDRLTCQRSSFPETRRSVQPRCLQLSEWGRSMVAHVRSTLPFSFQPEFSRLVPGDGEEIKFDRPGQSLLPHSIQTLAGRYSCNSGKRPPKVSEGGEEMNGKRREFTGSLLFAVMAFQYLAGGHRSFGGEKLDNIPRKVVLR